MGARSDTQVNPRRPMSSYVASFFLLFDFLGLHMLPLVAALQDHVLLRACGRDVVHPLHLNFCIQFWISVLLILTAVLLELRWRIRHESTPFSGSPFCTVWCCRTFWPGGTGARSSSSWRALGRHPNLARQTLQFYLFFVLSAPVQQLLHNVVVIIAEAVGHLDIARPETSAVDVYMLRPPLLGLQLQQLESCLIKVET